MTMNRDLQLTGGEPYARPFVPVGAVVGFDEIVFETITAADEKRDTRGL